MLKLAKFMEAEKSPKKFKILSILLFGFLISAIVVIVFLYKNQSLNYEIKLPFMQNGINIGFTYGEQSSLADYDFFKKVKDQFVVEKADFIEADLSKMVLRVFKAGELSYEVPILTKGRDGSWWETPAGLYKINTKEKNHFSSIGHVWMPWSMQFQGNFFIHGETYYDDGTPTSSQYSGGCIRLKTEDAKNVFDLISIGTPLLVFEESFSSDNFVYENKKDIKIKSPQYLAIDVLNNHVFAEESTKEQVPITDITKLMTALIATEHINIDKFVTVPQDAIQNTSKPRFNVGEQYTIYQLLFPLLLESSNEAAETIAKSYGREHFIKQMNTKAKAIGMTNTNFTDPSGISEENISTVEDLFMLTKYIYNNRSFIFDITSENVNTRIYGSSGFSDLENLNNFKDNELFYGGKNGTTTAEQKAGLTILKIPVGKTFRPIVFIILGSTESLSDGQILIDSVLTELGFK